LACLAATALAIVSAACEPLQLPESSTATARRPAAAATAPAATPTPPATDTAPATSSTLAAPAQRVALLLPLSGSQAGVGEAVRDGFLAAHLASAGPRPEILVLDESQSDPASTYRAAIEAGADAIVGPLLKESVAQIAPVAGTVPTLALNYLDATNTLPASFLQFALAPEDEARQAAEQAVAQGRFRAIALAPGSEWGRRVLGAFVARLEELGGTVLGYRLYDPAATDYTADIQRLLLLDESRERQRALAAFLGRSLDFETRRRADLDFIFLAANPGNGRLIRPQFRFLYAGDVPTYATSAIFQPGTGGEDDLDGIMFADAPALLDSTDAAQELRATLARRWPAGAQGRMRLYAMGHDAWHLMMTRGSLSAGLDGLSGRLYVDPQGRVHRRLNWARFQRNGVVPMETAPPVGLPQPDPARQLPESPLIGP
jgi:hypothetical protein